MARSAVTLDRPDMGPRQEGSRKPAPRAVSLRRLEQPLGPETNYWIELPRREVWPALFEFHDDDD